MYLILPPECPCPGLLLSVPWTGKRCNGNGRTTDLAFHDERPPRAFRKARVLPLKLRSSGCSHANHRKMWQQKKSWGLKMGQNWEKKWWMGFHGDRMGSNENWQTLMGMSSYGFSTKKNNNVMFCSLFIGLEWKHDELFRANCQSTEFGQLLRFVCTNKTFFNDTTGYVKPNPTMFLTAREKHNVQSKRQSPILWQKWQVLISAVYWFCAFQQMQTKNDKVQRVWKHVGFKPWKRKNKAF